MAIDGYPRNSSGLRAGLGEGGPVFAPTGKHGVGLDADRGRSGRSRCAGATRWPRQDYDQGGSCKTYAHAGRCLLLEQTAAKAKMRFWRQKRAGDRRISRARLDGIKHPAAITARGDVALGDEGSGARPIGGWVTAPKGAGVRVKGQDPAGGRLQAGAWHMIVFARHTPRGGPDMVRERGKCQGSAAR